MTLELRPARLDDAPFLLELRNDEDVRRQSRRRDPIGADEHTAWLVAHLKADKRCRLYIACADGEPIGQARLDLDETGAAEISIALTAAARGRRLGASLISLASERGSRELGARRVAAVIREGNDASYRAFLRAGYVDVGTAVGDLPGAARLLWERDD